MTQIAPQPRRALVSPGGLTRCYRHGLTACGYCGHLPAIVEPPTPQPMSNTTPTQRAPLSGVQRPLTPPPPLTRQSRRETPIDLDAPFGPPLPYWPGTEPANTALVEPATAPAPQPQAPTLAPSVAKVAKAEEHGANPSRCRNMAPDHGERVIEGREREKAKKPRQQCPCGARFICIPHPGRVEAFKPFCPVCRKRINDMKHRRKDPEAAAAWLLAEIKEGRWPR